MKTRDAEHMPQASAQPRQASPPARTASAAVSHSRYAPSATAWATRTPDAPSTHAICSTAARQCTAHRARCRAPFLLRANMRPYAASKRGTDTAASCARGTKGRAARSSSKALSAPRLKRGPAQLKVARDRRAASGPTARA